MGRLPRFDAAGAIHHVWASGPGPSPIFVGDGDRLDFLAIAASSFERFEVTCLQHCLMTTHYHLLVTAPEPVLSDTMERLNGLYAKSFNRHHGRRGHVFGDRFGSRWVQDDADLLGVVRYLALNPLDVPGCRRPADWPWCSYGNTIAGRADPLADTAALLRLAGCAERLRRLVERELPARLAAA